MMSTEVLLLVSLGFGIAALGLLSINAVQLQRQLREALVVFFLEVPQPETTAVAVRHNTRDTAENLFTPAELEGLRRLRQEVQKGRRR